MTKRITIASMHPTKLAQNREKINQCLHETGRLFENDIRIHTFWNNLANEASSEPRVHQIPTKSNHLVLHHIDSKAISEFLDNGSTNVVVTSDGRRLSVSSDDSDSVMWSETEKCEILKFYFNKTMITGLTFKHVFEMIYNYYTRSICNEIEIQLSGLDDDTKRKGI
eukprot:UN07682